MKITSFQHKDTVSFGLVRDECIVDVGQTVAEPGLRAYLRDHRLEDLADLASASPVIDLADIRFLPVIPDPTNIICIGTNYAAHIEETGRTPPPYPLLFTRSRTSQVGHKGKLIRSGKSRQYDFEGELAIVIGKCARHVPPADAFDYIAGYSCYNDGTMRDFQRHTSQFMPGKNFDRSGAFGPWIVPRSEIADPSELWLETRVNGEVMQRASISELVFDIPALVAYITQFMTLLPGDVIVTGTPAGVGAFRTPPVWLEPGDLVEVEISEIGVLSNEVADDDSTRI